MLFGRKVKRNRLFLLLRNFNFNIKFSRSKRYIALRLRRLKGSPYELAVGFSCGIAISFTPFIGTHALLAITFSWILGGSMATAVIGTLFGNPWTFPFIWFLSYEIGEFILNFWRLYDINMYEKNLFKEIMILLDIIKNVFITGDYEKIKLSFSSLILIPVMTLGSIPLVIISWLLSYFIIFRIIYKYNIKYSK